jgi:signal transduction histidine kinase
MLSLYPQNEIPFFYQLRRRWRQLLHLGIHEGMPFFEQQKTYLLNVLIIPLLLPLLFFFVLNLRNRTGLALLNLAALLNYSLIIYSNFSRCFLKWRILFSSLTAIIFFCQASLYNNGMEYSLLLMITGGVALIDSKIKFYLLAFGILCAFCYLRYQQYGFFHQDPGLFNRAMLNIVTSLVLFVLLLQHFKGIYLGYYLQLQKNKILLEQQQQQLLTHQWKLEEKNHELKELSEFRQRILFTLAHDLRSPLSGIEVLSGRIMSMEGSGKGVQTLLSIIKTTAERSQLQIQELLDTHEYLNVEQQGKVPVDIGKLIQGVIAPLQFKAAHKLITIELQQSGAPVMACINAMQLSRVVENLVDNAIKFSYMHSFIAVQVRIEEGQLLLSVCDDGIGIAAEERPFLFDNFMTAGRSGTMGEKSFGLGLSICRQIVDAHGGTIQLVPGQQKGCEFLVSIPSGNQV